MSNFKSLLINSNTNNKMMMMMMVMMMMVMMMLEEYIDYPAYDFIIIVYLYFIILNFNMKSFFNLASKAK